jgi:hypothetical protein
MMNVNGKNDRKKPNRKDETPALTRRFQHDLLVHSFSWLSWLSCFSWLSGFSWFTKRRSMIDYKPIAESNNFIIRHKYNRKSMVAENCQSESDLEREWITDLPNQGFEYRPEVNLGQALSRSSGGWAGRFSGGPGHPQRGPDGQRSADLR